MNGSGQRTIPNVVFPFRSMISKSRSAAYYGSEYQLPHYAATDISRREPLETAASLYTVAIGHKEADACRTRDSRFVSMRTATSWIFLGGGCLKSTPEEKVRQRFIETLINEYHYPANTIRREVPIQHGSKELRDKDGNPVRADIVVYASKAACLNRDQGKINFVVECKRNKVEDGYAQLVSYIFNTSANGGVWTNGDGTVFYRREDKDGIQVLEETPGLPRCGQGWEDGRTPRIGELERPCNVRRLLAMCHNRLYGRGMENADSDLTMDMVRILLAKIYDETVTSDTAYPHFWITPEQYKSEDGRATDKQKECVRMLRVQKGDILISRSGTIGKVTYATRILADKYVISDDLVRVRVPDENMRAYLLAFLMSSTAMNLMKLDEFGSVQQHLQPRHIWGLPVPVPDSWEQVSPIIDAGKGMISAMEQTSLADESLRTNGFDSLIE